MEQQRHDCREPHEREERGVDRRDPGERDDEDEHAGHRREARLEEDGGEDVGRPLLARDAAEPHDARERRPDHPGHVLRQHRGHLSLEGDAVRDPDPPGGEDPLPAENEEKVVGGENGQSREQVERARLAQARPRVAPRSADGVREEADDQGCEPELERDDDTPPPEDGEEGALHRSASAPSSVSTSRSASCVPKTSGGLILSTCPRGPSVLKRTPCAFARSTTWAARSRSSIPRKSPWPRTSLRSSCRSATARSRS